MNMQRPIFVFLPPFWSTNELIGVVPTSLSGDQYERIFRIVFVLLRVQRSEPVKQLRHGKMHFAVFMFHQSPHLFIGVRAERSPRMTCSYFLEKRFAEHFV